MKLDHYVDSSKTYNLSDIFDLIILARIDPRILSEEWLAKYTVRKNEKEFEEVTKKVQE
jgi:hypothetical protein